jgi:SAM-dependent methyltransferase
MGFYEDRVLPHAIGVVCGAKPLRRLRDQTCAGLTGDVLEVGFGSGLNIDHYPADVRVVHAVEPADVGWNMAKKRVAASKIPIERSGLDGQSLPFEDARFDSALSTFTLCTIPDVNAALREIRRVLKPGGQLHFLEHGLAPDEKVQRLQRRWEPIQNRIAGGCSVSRPIVELIRDAGFTIGEVAVFYGQRPKFFSAFKLGTATV